MAIRPAWQARPPLSCEALLDLLHHTLPEVNARAARFLGSGWDNDAFLVDARWCFRLPRRQLAVDLLMNERAILPNLLEDLPLDCAPPCWFGEPSERFSHPFNGYRYLEGETACRANPSTERRAAHAEVLGRFLRALHQRPLDAPWATSAPRDTLGRADLKKRAAWYASQLERLEGSRLLSTTQARRAREILGELEAACAPVPERACCWVHGDLYVRHLVVDPSQALCGVIDWGDVHIGDPALDLAIVFTYVPPEAFSAFVESYQEVTARHEQDVTLWNRARFFSLRHALALLDYGHDIADADLIREARQMFARFIGEG